MDTEMESETEPATSTKAIDLRQPGDRQFAHLLVNTLLVSVMNFTVWFAITFWIFIETRSVLATGMVAGIFLVATALSGIWFGSLVDHYRKKTVMQLSALTSWALFGVALIPVSFLAIRLAEDFIHPTVFTREGPQMSGAMFATFVVSWGAVTLLAYVLYRVELAGKRLDADLRELREALQ